MILSDESIKEKQERLAILFRDGLYDYDRYIKERDALQKARRRMAPRRVRYDWDAMRSLLRDLPTLVTLMHTDEVRETIHALFDIVWIKDQNVVALTPAAGLRPLIEAALEYTGSNINLQSGDESER